MISVQIGPESNIGDYAGIANVVVATLALFVAGLSIYFSRKTLYHQITHNKLSVRPIPFVSASDFEDFIRVKLYNNGSGPLIIKNLIASNRGKSADSIIEHMPNLPQNMAWKTFVGNISGRSIPAGDFITLFEFSGDCENSHFVVTRDECRKRLSDISVNLSYTDIYGDQFKDYSRDLSWFLRTK